MEKREFRRVKVLCGLFYMFCLFNFLGISLNLAGGRPQDEKVQREQSVREQGIKETVDENVFSVTEEAPKIAITFDDGPSSHCTGRLLDGLKERGVRATFFLIGKNVKENPDLVKRLYEEGHLIGNHTYNQV